jgi:hypothetical protein
MTSEGNKDDGVFLISVQDITRRLHGHANCDWHGGHAWNGPGVWAHFIIFMRYLRTFFTEQGHGITYRMSDRRISATSRIITFLGVWAFKHKYNTASTQTRLIAGQYTQIFAISIDPSAHIPSRDPLATRPSTKHHCMP